MAEPRMRNRHKGQQFDTKELEAYLTAYGDDFRPLPETVKVLDEAITDFIIETCHHAARTAASSHRAKIKVDDFKFALRKDPRKLGRVTELLAKDKELKSSRKLFDDDVEREGAREGKRQKRDDLEADAAGAGAGAAKGKAGGDKDKGDRSKG